MTKDAKPVSGVLDADGITIRLNSKIALPPGRVAVIVSPESASDSTLKPKLTSGFLTPDGRPTGRYAAYLKYQEKYTKVKQEFDAAYSAALVDPAQLHQWPIIGVGLKAAVDAAWQQWVTLGFKDEIERQLAGDK